MGANVFGQGNMHGSYFSIFIGWGTSSALVHLGYISYPFSCNVINVIKHT